MWNLFQESMILLPLKQKGYYRLVINTNYNSSVLCSVFDDIIALFIDMW